MRTIAIVSRIGVALLGLTLVPSMASAELRRAEFKLEGMDCAYCNGAMGAAVRKLDGVESVELIADKGTAVIRLKPDNKITLPQLRRVIKSVGYEIKAVDISARGRIVVSAGKPGFDLMNGSVLELAGEPREPADAIVEITGISKPGDKDGEILTIATVR